MNPSDLLPTLLGVAVLLPLVSFFVILLAGPRLGKAGHNAAYVASSCIANARWGSSICFSERPGRSRGT